MTRGVSQPRSLYRSAKASFCAFLSLAVFALRRARGMEESWTTWIR